MTLIYHLKETKWRHAALNTQQVVLRRADSRYAEVFLIKAWMLPWVRTLQTDSRDSDESRTEVSGVQGEGTGRGGGGIAMELKKTQLMRKTTRTKTRHRNRGRRDRAGNLSNSTQTSFVGNLNPPAAVNTWQRSKRPIIYKYPKKKYIYT